VVYAPDPGSFDSGRQRFGKAIENHGTAAINRMTRQPTVDAFVVVAACRHSACYEILRAWPFLKSARRLVQARAPPASA
jgi:hypothetical protein